MPIPKTTANPMTASERAAAYVDRQHALGRSRYNAWVSAAERGHLARELRAMRMGLDLARRLQVHRRSYRSLVMFWRLWWAE